MDEKGEANPEVIAEFGKRRMRQLIAIIPVVMAIVPLLLLEDAGPEGVFGIPAVVIAPISIGVVIGILIFSVINWRCPACRRYLGRGMSPRFCPKCGVPLQA